MICGALMALTIAAAGAEEEDPINVSPYVTTAILSDCEALIEGHYRDSPFYGTLCTGMISGLVYAGQQSVRCLTFPKGVTRQQAIRVVVRYIEYA
jgi:hypothetical protein